MYVSVNQTLWSKGFPSSMPFAQSLAVTTAEFAPDGNCLNGVLLVVVYVVSAARFVEKISFAESLAGAGHEEEIVGPQTIHRERIVILDGQLRLGIEECDCFLDIEGRVRRGFGSG